MKLLHVVPTYLPATRYGGPIFAVHGLCKALAARGHEVEVFTTNVDGDGVSDVPLDRDVLLDGVRVRYFASELRRLYVSRSMRAALRSRAAEFDVVHVHSAFLWPPAAAARAAYAAGTPYVVSPRGMLVEELIRRKSRIVKRAWIGLVERRTFARAAAIHFTAQRELDDARNLGMPIPRALVIPNGIDLPPLAPRPRDANTILFLGRVNWKKGLDRLIEAVDRVPAARLVIAGRDDENAIATLPRSEHVTFAGEVAGERKEELLRTAAMLVLPSLSENFGNVVLEAMAHETPVIVTPAVGLADEVRRSGAGLVSDGDPESLASAIATLLADPARRESMGRRGREAAEQRYAWSRVAEELEAAYASLRTT